MACVPGWFIVYAMCQSSLSIQCLWFAWHCISEPAVATQSDGNVFWEASSLRFYRILLLFITIIVLFPGAINKDWWDMMTARERERNKTLFHISHSTDIRERHFLSFSGWLDQVNPKPISLLCLFLGFINILPVEFRHNVMFLFSGGFPWFIICFALFSTMNAS